MPHPTPEVAAYPTSGESLFLERSKESCQAKGLLDRARLAFDAGDNRHAADLATQAAAEARRQHLAGLEVLAFLMLSECALNDSDLRAAVQHGLSAWTIACASADGSLQCRSRLALARVSFQVGDYSQALADLESVRQVTLSIDDDRLQFRFCTFLGNLHAALDQHTEALEAGSQALDLAERLQDTRCLAVATGNLASHRLAQAKRMVTQGQQAEAGAAARETLALNDSALRLAGQAQAIRLNLAHHGIRLGALILLGRDDQALQAYADYRALRERIETVENGSLPDIDAARLLQRRGDLAGARDVLRPCIDHARQGRQHAVLVDLYAAAGEIEEADGRMSEALRLHKLMHQASRRSASQLAEGRALIMKVRLDTAQAQHDAATAQQRAEGLALRNRELELRAEALEQERHAAELARLEAAARARDAAAAERAERIHALNAVLSEGVAALAAGQKMPNLIDSIMSSAQRVASACCAGLYVQNPDTDVLEFIGFREHSAVTWRSRDEAANPLPDLACISEHPAWQFMQSQRSVVMHAVAEGGHIAPQAVAFQRQLGHGSVAWVPIRSGERLRGWYGLSWTRLAVQLDAETVAMLMTLAQQLALALELSAMGTRLRESEVREAVADERARMARDIHDSLAQSFTSIAMQTEVLLSRPPDAPQQRRTLARIAATARSGIDVARATAMALLPAENWAGALDEALASLAERCTIDDRAACAFESAGTPTLLPLQLQEGVMRMAQEAASNAMRHSGCSRLDIRLEYRTDELSLTVADNGRGMPGVAPDPGGGMGLKGMGVRARQLGGSCVVAQPDEGGTRVCITLPLAGGKGRS